MHILSSECNLIKIDITELNDQSNIDSNISDIKLYGDIQSMKDITIYNKFVNMQLNQNDEFVSIYDTEYVNNNFQSMSCMVNIILEYKPYFEGKWNNGNRLFKTQPEFTY